MFLGRNLKTENVTILAQCSISALSQNGRKRGVIENLSFDELVRKDNKMTGRQWNLKIYPTDIFYIFKFVPEILAKMLASLTSKIWVLINKKVRS